MEPPKKGEPESEPSCKKFRDNSPSRKDSGYTSQSSNNASSSSNPAEEDPLADVVDVGVVDFDNFLRDVIPHHEEHPEEPQNALLCNEPQVPSNSQSLDEDYAVPPSPQSPGQDSDEDGSSDSSDVVGGRFPDSPVHERLQFDHLDEVGVGLLGVISVEGKSRQDRTEEQGLVTRTVLDISDANFNVAHYNYLFDLSHPHFLRNYHFLRRGTAYPLSRISAIISEHVSRTLEYIIVDGMPLDRRVALGWIRDLFNALKFLKSENVVHGRITPWRVFFDEGDVLKLHLVPHQLIPLDMNLAYTANEVPNEKSDVYSAVSVAYGLLERREPPLDKTGLHSILVSAETNQLFTRSWAPPEDRPTAEELLNAIKSEILLPFDI